MADEYRIECRAADIDFDYSLYEDCLMCEVVHLKGQHLTVADVEPDDRWWCEVCGKDTMPGLLVCKECRNR